MNYNFHPPLSSAPAVLLTVCLVTELAARISGRERLRAAALVLFVFAAAAVPVTYLSGLLNEDLVAKAVQSRAHDAIERHEDLGRICLILTVLPVLFRVLEGAVRSASARSRLGAFYLGFLAVLTGLIAYTSFLGGSLVFDYGAGVAEQPPAAP
jgi:uncharacterized membrane protein